jgi:hypothetical protein
MKSEDYPCFCLCRGFAQMTYRSPCRLTDLHLTQIFLTEAFTRIVVCIIKRQDSTRHMTMRDEFVDITLSHSLNNSQLSAVRIILQRYPVSDEYFDAMNTHFPREVCKDFLSALCGNAKHSIRKRLTDCTAYSLLIITHVKWVLRY